MGSGVDIPPGRTTAPLSKSQVQVVDVLCDAAADVSARMTVSSVERLLSILRTLAPVVRGKNYELTSSMRYGSNKYPWPASLST